MVRRITFLCSLVFALFFGILVWSSYTPSSFARTSTAPSKPAALEIAQTYTSTATTTMPLRVLSWNIQFGEGTDGINNFDRLANWIANINPDLIGLCEIPPGTVPELVSLLTQKTGKLWFPHFFPKFPGCDEGNLSFLSSARVGVSLLFVSASRSVVDATINVGGVNLSFFATHL